MSVQLSERLSGGKFNTEMPWVRNSACKATTLLYFWHLNIFVYTTYHKKRLPCTRKFLMAMKVFQSQASKIRRKTLCMVKHPLVTTHMLLHDPLDVNVLTLSFLSLPASLVSSGSGFDPAHLLELKLINN